MAMATTTTNRHGRRPNRGGQRGRGRLEEEYYGWEVLRGMRWSGSGGLRWRISDCGGGGRAGQTCSGWRRVKNG